MVGITDKQKKGVTRMHLAWLGTCDPQLTVFSYYNMVYHSWHTQKLQIYNFLDFKSVLMLI